MTKIWFVFLVIFLSSLMVPVLGNSTVISGPFTLDTGINPGDDFSGYVNNIWIANHPLPANKSSYNSFTEVREQTTDKVHTIIEQEAKRYTSGDENQIGRFYNSGMDTDAINRQGLTPLADELRKINAIQTSDDLNNVSADLVAYGIFPFFMYYADQDPTNSTCIIPHIYQGGIGLPDRDYYFRNDTESKQIQEAYREHIKNVFLLMNSSETEADQYANTIYKIEENIASSHYTMVEDRDPINTTHIVPWEDLKTRYPAIGWDQLAEINGSGKPNLTDLYQLTAIEHLNQMLSTVPLDDWKTFLTYKVIDSLSPYLATPYDDENFRFYSHILNGIESPEPRWKRVTGIVNAGLADEVGKQYVDTYFNDSARQEAKTLSHAIRSTLRERISNISWMDDQTKQAAMEKIDVMVEKIGYPDTWMDYTGLNLTDTYVSNVLETNNFNQIHGPMGLERIGKSVDRTMWFMSPQTVNAYYNPLLNEIVFPAAILQPPFFSAGANDSINYGAIGSIIGHEMTHGFDDEGRQYDKDGNLRDWWTVNDSIRFNNQTYFLVTQYNGFEVVPGVFINGNQTLGENIADFGGVTLAYHAWEQNGRDLLDQPDSANITPAQRFFISFANCWAGSARDEFLRTITYTDPHPWGAFRANGAPFNVPEFYEAFPTIGQENTLYRSTEQRPVIW